MATDAVCCTHWRHCHTDRAAQNHWLLTHHRLGLIAHVHLPLRWVLGWWILWVLGLSVRLLSILRLSIRCWIRLLLWRILSRRRSVASISGLGRRCPNLATTTGAEMYARVIVKSTAGTKSTDRSCWSVHILPTTGAKSVICGHFCLASRAMKSCRLRWGGGWIHHLRTQRRAAMITKC